MALMGSAVIAIFSAIDPGMLEEHDAWHTTEHLPERMALPGFLRGRRTHALDAANTEQRFIFYEIDGIAVATSAPYLERLDNPTPWSRKIMAASRLNRTLCRVAASAGSGLGGHLLVLRLSPQPGRAEALGGWLAGKALPALARSSGIVGAHLLQKDAQTVRPLTGEERLRHGGVDASADWIVIVEASAGEALAPIDIEMRLRERGADCRFAGRYALAQFAVR